MKKLFIPLFGMFFLCAMDINSTARAADWTIPANPGCEVGLGNVTNTGPGFTASGGSAVIGCSLTKIVGNGNLNWVYARINRNLPGGSDPVCNLDSYDSDGAPSSTTFGFASDGAGFKSIGMPLPTIYSFGYLRLYCTLNSGDTFYGVRYGQDD